MFPMSVGREFKRREREWLKILGQMERGDGEVDYGGRAERPRGNTGVKEVGRVRRSEVMGGFECKELDLVVNAVEFV